MRRRVTDTVQYWGPGLIAIITLLVTIADGMERERQIGRLEGRVYAVEREHAQGLQNCQQKIDTLQAYVNSLEKTIIRSGIPLPAKAEKEK